ncbi:MAG: BTAD domain-containing putative transcriptional regulator [Chloroflexota bacterium]
MDLTIEKPGLDVAPVVLISLLGTFKLTLDGHLAPISHGSKSEALLTYLALARHRPLQRDSLLGYLWPDCDPIQAGQSLNSLVYQLNKLTKRFVGHVNLVNNDSGYYFLNMSEGVGVDIDFFEAWSGKGQYLLQQGHIKQGLSYCEQALDLYRGDLVAVTDIQTVLERERLRTAFLDLLAALADHYAQQTPTTALTYIHQLLKYDPCREDAHRLAMRCYVQLQTRAQALRQYQLCRQILATEFETTPEPATETLYNQIRLNPESLTNAASHSSIKH